MRSGLNFCTRGGFQATVYEAKFRNSYVFWITDYDIYAKYNPILFYFLVSFVIGVVTQLTNAFLVWFYYSWNACELCYTKILSPSCDKKFDIPTCPKSQLLEWKLISFVNLFIQILSTALDPLSICNTLVSTAHTPFPTSGATAYGP